MTYPHTEKGVFVSRPNRFLAWVDTGRGKELCHVKNTGRLKELLLPGAVVSLSVSDNPARKTRTDLVAVHHDGQWINIDSQAPNQVAAAYLPVLFAGVNRIQPEYRHGDSQLDFYLEVADAQPVYVEVKGVTLASGDTALFPDAPTQRGVKHLHELTAIAQAGGLACLLFVIQMHGVSRLCPNDLTHPAFGEALRAARAAGVMLHAVDCVATADSLLPGMPVPVHVARIGACE